MECPKCGAHNADTASFCNLCNESFEKANPTPPVEETKEDQADDKTEIIEKKHAVPGFGIKVTKKSPEESTIQKTPKLRKTEPKPERKISSLKMESITDWLYAALVSTVIALIAVFLVPKEQINANLALGRIILAVFMVGFVVSSDGLVKIKFQQSLMGWLLGVSAGSLAFLLIFVSLLLVRISPRFYTIYFLGSEIIIVCGLLAISVALLLSLERVSASQLIRLVLGVALISLTISWLILRWTNPLPFIAFTAWPISYYLMKWVSK